MNQQAVTDSNHHFNFKCISWTAVLSGAIVAVGLSFLLNLFTVAIGLSAFSTSPEGNATLAVGSFIWLVIGSFVTMFIAGSVAGCLAKPYCNTHKRHLGELYGFLAWSVALITAILLTAHIGNFVSNAGNVSNPNQTTVNLSNNANRPLMAQQTHRAAATTTSTRVTVNTEKAANSLGMAAFVTFFLFFIGALASCFGARWAISCKKDEMDNNSTYTRR